MPSFVSSLHVLGDHIWLGVIAALLFVAGVATAAPVVRYDVRALMAFPLWVVRRVMRFLGPDFQPVKVFLFIFLFNTAAIFVYMMSGVLVVLPAAMAFLTGLNIGVVVLRARELEAADDVPPVAGPLMAPHTGPVPSWVGFCSTLVLILELPSFWLSVGMGVGMARRLSAVGSFTLDNLRVLAAERIHAYWMVIIPALFLSAIAETVAIRGHMGKGHHP